MEVKYVYRANVTEILLKDGKAVGVKLLNGEEFTRILLYPIPQDGILLGLIILKRFN